jgi:hypothetical protein
MSRVVEECSEVLKCMESLQAYMCRKCDSYRERNGAVPDEATGAMLGPLWVQTVLNSLYTALRIAVR